MAIEENAVRAADAPAESSRPFWQFWTASTISGAGTAVTTIALPLLAVITIRASSLQVGILAAATDIAWLIIGLPAGVIVGRLPLRGSQVAMDLIRAAGIATIPIAAAAHVLSFVQLVAVALIVSVATVLFGVGNSTYLPTIVSEDQLVKRNSLTTGSDAAVQLGGPSLGGLLVQLIGAPAAMIVDAVSYVVSGVLLMGLARPDASVVPKTHGVGLTRLIRDGWRCVFDHPLMRPCVFAAALVNATAGGLLALTPLFLVRTLHASATVVGLVIATDGVGSMLGAAVAARIAARLGSARAVLTASLVSGLGIILLPFARPGWGLLTFVLGNVGFASGVTVLSILTRTFRQKATPRELLSRVMATVRFISWGVIPIGSLAAGVLATATTNRAALALVAIPTILAPVVLWLSPVRLHRELA